MRFVLEIDATGDAFDEPDARAEVARLLRRAASAVVEGEEQSGSLVDISGNTVGSWATRDPDQHRQAYYIDGDVLKAADGHVVGRIVT